MLAGIALGILLLTINASTAFVRMRELDENNRRVAHTHRVLAKLQETHSLLQAADAGKHRFLLVADPDHLAPLRFAVTTVSDRLSELRGLTNGNPRHQARLDQLQNLAKDKMREFKEATEFHEMNFVSIRDHLRARPGRLAMDQIRVLIDEMRAEEEALLAHHDAQSQASLIGTRSTLVLSSLADFALLALACWLIRRDFRNRQISERSLRDYAKALELANGELSRLCREA
jgi:CHASE3 domain sensor protein